MNSLVITLLLVVVCIIGGYFLAQFWAPLGWVGLIAALALVGMYVFGRNRRIQ